MTVLRRLVAAGVSAAQLLAALEAMIAAAQPAIERKKKRDAERAKTMREARAVLKVVAKRDGRRCRYCGTEKGPFAFDHVIPLSRGGPTSEENLTVACKSCNSAKRDRTPNEWMGS